MTNVEAERLLAAIAELVEIPARTVIYKKDSDAAFVYNIIGGAVKTYQLFADGTCCISAFLFSQNVAGLSKHGKYIDTAETINAVRAYRIPIERLKRPSEFHSRLSVDLLPRVVKALVQAQYRAAIASRPALRRVASFLLWLDEELSSDNASNIYLAVPMTRRDIADYLALSVESVSRVLSALEGEGALRRDGPRNLELLDRQKLQLLSGLR